MASTNKTALGLNQWVSTDRPKWADFNQDNLIIEEQLQKRALLDEDGHVQQAAANSLALGGKAYSELFDASGKAKTSLNSENLGGTAASGDQLKDTALKWYDLELMNEFNPSTSQTPQYMRDNGGWVQVLCSFNRSTPPDSFEQLAVLPQGYRPPKQIHVPVIAGIGTWSSYVTINPSGSINFYNGSISSGWPNGALGFNVVFKTVV